MIPDFTAFSLFTGKTNPVVGKIRTLFCPSNDTIFLSSRTKLIASFMFAKSQGFSNSMIKFWNSCAFPSGKVTTPL